MTLSGNVLLSPRLPFSPWRFLSSLMTLEPTQSTSLTVRSEWEPALHFRVIHSKERLRQCSTLQKSKEIWQLNAISVPCLDPVLEEREKLPEAWLDQSTKLEYGCQTRWSKYCINVNMWRWQSCYRFAKAFLGSARRLQDVHGKWN